MVLSLLMVVRSQSLPSDELLPLTRTEDDYQPAEMCSFPVVPLILKCFSFRQFKKSFVRPCVYNMGNCITSTQQERLIKHLRSLVALRDQR